MTSCYKTYPYFKRPPAVIPSGKIYESNLSELDLLADSQIYKHLEPAGILFYSTTFNDNVIM